MKKICSQCGKYFEKDFSTEGYHGDFCDVVCERIYLRKRGLIPDIGTMMGNLK